MFYTAAKCICSEENIFEKQFLAGLKTIENQHTVRGWKEEGRERQTETETDRQTETEGMQASRHTD